MSPVSRRRLLQGMGASLGVGMAGCSALTEESAPTQLRLVELSVDNLDPRAHTVQVLIEADGDPVYWNSMHATAFDTETATAGGGTFDGYPTAPGKYTVYARYEDQPPDESARLAWSSVAESYAGDSDVPCVGLSIRIGSLADQADPPDLSIMTAVTC